MLNPSADIAREVLDYLRSEHSYGNKVTGKLASAAVPGASATVTASVIDVLSFFIATRLSLRLVVAKRRAKSQMRCMQAKDAWFAVAPTGFEPVLPP